jgi:2-hydroxymuconate-semialdehyde hydrolase
MELAMTAVESGRSEFAASLSRYPGRTEMINGTQTRLFEAGKGEPVILIHGSGAGVTSWANWYRNVDALATQFHVLAFELPGFGGSALPAALTFDDWTDHLEAVLDAQGWSQAHLIGNSLGGWVAFEFASRAPERVKRLVAMGAGGTEITQTAAVSRGTKFDPSVGAMRRVLERFVVDPALVTDELVEHRLGYASTPAQLDALEITMAVRNKQRFERPLAAEQLARVECPVLLIHGVNDHAIPPESSLWLAKHLPDANLEVWPHCRHWSQLEHATRFNETTLEFLSAQGRFAPSSSSERQKHE